MSPGVGVLGHAGATPVAAVGESLFVCVAAQEAAVSLIAPSGAAVPFPSADDTSTVGDGFQVLGTAESSRSDDGTNEVEDDDDLAAEYEVRSFPGAEVGTYALVVDRGDEALSTSIVDIIAQSSAKIFDFERFRFGVENPPANVGDLATFGLVGFVPDTDVELAVYRSREESEIRPGEIAATCDPCGYELSDLVTVRTDDRGEAVLRFPLTDDARGRCLLVIEPAEANSLVGNVDEGLNTGFGLDPRMLCVAR